MTEAPARAAVGLAWAKAVFAFVAFVLPVALAGPWLASVDRVKDPDGWVQRALAAQLGGCVVLLAFCAFVRPSASWRISGRLVLRAAAAYLCFLVPWMLIVLGYASLLQAAGKPIEAQPHLMYFTRTHALGSPYLLALLTVCVVQPLAEEALFRGHLTDALTSVLGTRLGDLAGAVLFGLVHTPLQNAPPIVLLGLLFAVLRRRSGSLAPSALAHCLHNTAMVLLAGLEPRLLTN
jgi:membrane protease YdiL (CAAX protease family)